MNKLFTKIATACVGLAMAVGVGVAVGSNDLEAIPVHADSSTVTFSDAGWDNGTKPTSFSLGGFDFVCEKVSGSNAPAYYTSDSTLRFYNKCTMTISKSGYSITNAVCSSAASSGAVSGDSFVCTFTASIRVTSVTITYVASGTPTPDPENVTINGSASQITTKEYLELSATVTATGGTPSQDVTWSSSNESAATVTSDGKVEAVAVGTTTIRATATGFDGVYDEFELEVIDPIFKMVTSTTQLEDGDTVALGAFYNDKWYITGTPSESAPSSGNQYWSNVDEVAVSNYMFNESALNEGVTWTYNVNNDVVTFRDQYNSNKYLGTSYSDKKWKSGESATSGDNTKWTISFADGVLRMTSNASSSGTIDFLMYNNTTPEFKTYSATSYTESSMRLFKSAGKGIAYSSVTTSTESVTVTAGNNTSFTFEASPEFNTDTLSISSADEDVATISVNGSTVTVTGVAAGSTSVLFKNSANETLKSVSVTVNEAVSYNHISIDASNMLKTYTIGDSINLDGVKVYAYTTADDSGTPVDVTGEATITSNPATANAVSDELAVTVSASYKNGSNNLNDEENVSVLVNPILVEGVVLTYAKSIYEVGDSALPSAIGVTNDDATDKTLTVTSNNPAVIEVTNSTTGEIRFVSGGTATITATANDASGQSASVELTSKVIFAIDRYIDRDRISNLDGTYQSDAEVSSTFDGITYITVDVMKRTNPTGSTNFQFKGSDGYLKNDTGLGGSIKTITIFGINGTKEPSVAGCATKDGEFTDISGTITNGTGVFNFGENNFRFFKISAGSGATYFDSFKIEMKDSFASDLNTFANSFNEIVGENCASFSLDKWASITSLYNSLTSDEKEALKGITVSDLINGEGTTLDIALRRYDNIVANYGVTDFAGRSSQNSNSVISINESLSNNSNSSLMIIALISIVGVTAIGGYFFLRKKKEQ